ncbi:MAG TPA: hypothetical protein VHQ47_12630 [Phycisphaerae bacterium]|nr:hypothetical protein [Phycisphaerae bacterium]
MKTVLTCINFLGVLTLASLCAIQWSASRTLHLELLGAQAAQQTLTAKLDDQTKTIAALHDDLDEFRSRINRTDDALQSTQKDLDTARQDVARLTSQRKDLQATVDAQKKALTQWSAAVNARDAALKASAARVEALAADRNAAVSRYNDLATQYNKAVDELKQAAASIQSLISQRNDAVQRYNALAQARPATQPAAP